MSDQRIKMIFGFCLLAVLAILATVIGLGKVEQQTSFGLRDVLIILAGVGGAWSQWAFGSKGEAPKP